MAANVPPTRLGVKVGIHAQHIDPLVGPDLMLSNINKDLTISRADRSRHPHSPGREHGLLIGDISNRIGAHLTNDQLLDREGARVGVKPPDPTLLPTSHHDHFPGWTAETVRAGDRRSMIRQHRAAPATHRQVLGGPLRRPAEFVRRQDQRNGYL